VILGEELELSDPENIKATEKKKKIFTYLLGGKFKW
jgi:hypothetical protein